MLWVTADPGWGKSVLSKSLIDNELRSTNSRTTCYFFFKDDNKDQTAVTNALCAILHQLFSTKRELLGHAIPEFISHGEKLPKLFAALWKILLSAAEDPEAGEIICILDALDECEESGRIQLINSLTDLYCNATGNRGDATLKFLVTSRPYYNIERSFAELTSKFPTIRLAGEGESESIKREIDIVIKARVQKIGTKLMLDDSERISLEEDFLSIPHRTYLWVDLTFKEIEQRLAITKKRLRTIIGTIPDTLDKTYETILERSTDKLQARKLLHIIVSAIRPLTLREMNTALAIDKGSKSQEELDLEPEDRFYITVRNVCGLFVHVIDSRIYLIHQTAKDFLVKNDTIQPSRMGIWKHSLEPRESNLILTEICVWYLLFTVFESDPLVINGRASQHELKSHVNRYTNRHDFLDYSARHWAAHFRRATIMDGVIFELAREFCNSRSKRFPTWFQVYWTNVDPSSRYPRNFIDLTVASYLRLETMVEVVLEEGEEFEPKDGWVALYRAASIEDKAVIRMLLETGADVEAENKGRTALDWAAENGHEAVVGLLLEKGLDDNGRVALYWATENGHEEAVGLLLKNGADVNAKDEYGSTALHWATWEGHEGVVRLLLGKGADIDAKDIDGWTAMRFAVQKREMAMAMLLFEKGAADFNTKDKNGWTMLYRAAQNGDKDIVSSLLDKGADIYAKNKEGRTALHLAAWMGHEAVVRLLLEKGAIVEAKDIDGWTAQHCAAFTGQEAVERLFKAFI
jgi:ankyrin repeat domain-containing protein 50